MIPNAYSLTGGTVLISGASGGIGSATAKILSTAGAFVFIHYRNSEQKAQALLDEIKAAGGVGHCLQADLNTPSSIADLFKQMANVHEYPNMLVNMAARQEVRAFDSMTLKEWQAMMRLNQDAAFLLMQQFCQTPTSQRDRAIVNVASIEGLDPAVGHSHYASSKAALLMLSRAVALEMGGQKIRVNSVSPGLIDRPGLAEDWPDGLQRWQARCPLETLGEADDVAHAICFLLSSAAKWINGANLVVDGGMSARDRW